VTKKKIIVLPVIYVAAGPGDPQLITLRGINALKQAELIIADVNTMDIANAHANENADVVAAVDEDGVPMAPAVRARLAIDAAKEGAFREFHQSLQFQLMPECHFLPIKEKKFTSSMAQNQLIGLCI